VEKSPTVQEHTPSPQPIKGMEIVRLTRSREKTKKDISNPDLGPSTSRKLLSEEKTQAGSMLVDHTGNSELLERWNILELRKQEKLIIMEEYRGGFGPFEELDQGGFWIHQASGSIKHLDEDLRSVG
jgi:hypothetical protein